MNITFETYPLPEQGKINLNLKRSLTIKITAKEAQRQVNRWLLLDVSYLMGADPPTLVIGEQVVWRVAVWLGLPHTGKVGIVGTVDVDVEIGTMYNLTEKKLEIEETLKKLEPFIPAYEPKSGDIGQAYVAKNIPSALVLTPSESEVTFLPEKVG